MLARLKAFDRKAEESRLIVNLLLSNPHYKEAKTILAYHPMSTEPDIKPILLDPRVALPYIADGKMHFSKAKETARSAYGFQEPKDKTPIEYDKALILVPLLAFDDRLYRLGRGGGFYDRYLSENRERLFAVGIAYSASYCPELPVEEHDQRLDLVISANR